MRPLRPPGGRLSHHVPAGAYYYYKTETLPNGSSATYERTLLDVHAYARREGIPYRYALLDSWWYTKGKGGGVAEWDARPDVFPSGLAAFHAATNWSFQMHNRMWSANNVYAKANGGRYDFIVEKTLAVPNDQRLWDDLIANKTAVGLVVYEQDWLYNELEGVEALLHTQGLSRTWLMQMGRGAAKSNVAVQYCMECVPPAPKP